MISCRKKRTPEEILDVRGLRLIVSDENNCYEALQIVHKIWKQVPGKSKDYIAHSKPNGYSIKPSLMGPFQVASNYELSSSWLVVRFVLFVVVDR